MVVAALGLPWVGGCGGSPPLGLLEVRWTIAGDTDVERCESSGSDALGLSLDDENGRELLRQRYACEEFGTLIDSMPVGVFTVRATLLTVDGEPVQGELAETGVVLHEDTWTRVSFAF